MPDALCVTARQCPRVKKPTRAVTCRDLGRGAAAFRRFEGIQPGSEKFRSSPRTFKATLENYSSSPRQVTSAIRRRRGDPEGQNKKIDAPLNARFRQIWG